MARAWRTEPRTNTWADVLCLGHLGTARPESKTCHARHGPCSSQAGHGPFATSRFTVKRKRYNCCLDFPKPIHLFQEHISPP